MKKLIFLLMFLTVSAQAKSVKLGDAELNVSVNQSRECIDHSMCSRGLCVDGKCTLCSSKYPCPADKKCIMGVCILDPPCRTNSDCPKGVCNTNTAKCVECVIDTDCHSGSAKGSRCVKNVCENCAATDLNCGACGEAQKPDGSGGCVCADDSFNNSGTCTKLCDSTICPPNEIGEYDENMSCCCSRCPKGTFLLDGKCVNTCNYVICISGSKKEKENSCCCG